MPKEALKRTAQKAFLALLAFLRYLPRLIRICLGVFLCLNLAAWAVLTLFPKPDEAIASANSLMLAALFLFLPALLYGAMFLALPIAFDIRGVRSLRAHVAVWTVLVGLWCIAAPTPTQLAGVGIGAASGLVYWLLAGRLAGQPDLGRGGGVVLHPVDRLLTALFVVAAIVLTGQWAVGKVRASMFDGDPGTPAYVWTYRREMPNSLKLTLMDYPDAASCPVLEGADMPEGLPPPLDWPRVHSHSVAKVCVFRLLQATDGLEAAAAWFEAQGFRVSREEGGQIRTYGHRTSPEIRFDAGRRLRSEQNGAFVYSPLILPKLPLARLFSHMAYGMSFNICYPVEGNRPLRVETSSSTL